eukprot:gene16902-8386_t
MPPKKKGQKKGLKEKKREEEKLKIAILLKELRNNYESKCATVHSLCHQDVIKQMRRYADEGQLLSKIILTNGPADEELKVKLSPVIAAIRSIRYLHLKEMFIWEITVKYEDLLALSNFFQQPMYSLSYLELVDCKIDGFSLESFKDCLTTCSLSALVLDYNEFGDQGCAAICAGLVGNKSLTKLSLKFCNLSSESGSSLGKAVSESAVSELYLDGNKLECEGLVELIRLLVDKSEQEARERKENERNQASSSETGGQRFLGVPTSMSKIRSSSALSTKSNISVKPISSTTSTGRKSAKKKRKKSPKKKAPPPPPKVGPWLTKLHVMDNCIDSHGIALKYGPVLTMRLLRRWISTSADLKELDIDDNLIGDLGGREILGGLQDRKEAGLSNLTVWVTHRMHPDTFNKILTLGTAGKKKKKRGKGKGKPGKVH